MGLGSFLFGSDKQETQLPDWYNNLGQGVASRAQAVSNLGFAHWRGPDVAAFSPMQNAAFQGVSQAASAFGMPSGQGDYLPKPTTYAGGVQGYSAQPLYQQQLAAFRQAQPDLYNAMIGTMTHPGAGPAEARPQGGSQGGASNQADRPPAPPPPENGTYTWSPDLNAYLGGRSGRLDKIWTGSEWVDRGPSGGRDNAVSHAGFRNNASSAATQVRPQARPADLNTTPGAAPQRQGWNPDTHLGFHGWGDVVDGGGPGRSGLVGGVIRALLNRRA